MIESILIEKEASYGYPGETLAGLSKFNFIYGSNGTGKTTISRVIADEALFSDCHLLWQGGIALEPLVYNRDFVENNFNQSSELKGIFTLGEKDSDILQQIGEAKEALILLKNEGLKLKNTLEGEDGNGGKKAELSRLESDFEEKCWKLQKTYQSKFQEAFTGARGKKSVFKSKLLTEATSNSAELKILQELESKAGTVFGETPRPEVMVAVPNYDDLISLESAPILKKKVIGKDDVDIAAMVQKLGNSDWVKQGRKFYEISDDFCPFCQQSIEPSFADSLNAYFDEAFEKDVSKIDSLRSDYKTSSERLQTSLEALFVDPPKFLNVEKLKVEMEILDSRIKVNFQIIEKKRKEISQSVSLDSLENVVTKIGDLIDAANNAISEHNKMVSNLTQEKADLTSQVWKYLLELEIADDLPTYQSKKKNIQAAIVSLTTQIEQKRADYKDKDTEIKQLEKNTTSIQPTIDGINSLLESFGFTGFSLGRSENDRFYKIQRPDGADAQETLSEGEKSFITFLYFYHLLKGSDSETGMTTDRVIVFDDPVSSLDSDILFIVSSLIRGLLDEVKIDHGHIKQVFVLTHNIYFHKEITFNQNRKDKALSGETFWMVRKPHQLSKITQYDTNPIKTSYELLWAELKTRDHSNLSIQNTMRRILENYFKILGGMNSNDICEKFEGRDKFICGSLFSWINSGSHSTNDDLFITVDDSSIDRYLEVFKQIFYKTNHDAHYQMMMNEPLENGDIAVP